MLGAACDGDVHQSIGKQSAAAESQSAQPAAQVEQQSEQSEDATEPLTVTLTRLGNIYEVERALQGRGGETYTDDEGNTRQREIDFGWRDPAFTMVRWQVTGGVPPYTLTIDGEPRDGRGLHDRADGWAQASCALMIGETYFRQFAPEDDYHPRYHRTEPTVDSGWKTITAVVTDAAGNTATASTEVYMLLHVNSGGKALSAGETYRVRGVLVTVPAGLTDLQSGGVVEGDGGDAFFLVVPGSPYNTLLLLDADTGEEVWRRIGAGPILNPKERSAGAEDEAGGQAEHPHHTAFDQLVESAGQPPNLDRSGR